ncbi:hypothetical protein FOJ82_01115 [Tessaracoccus rhinocerotis]|uniref:Uncharacterized protein n=1 Tax=Tessaracoccus rhinocerotis TaxID=1689449 RepID=A0A553K4B8_9ACTN|nr:hypothetical protein [Tessaracoccus rhinocerotis]TRY19533.1 hypothetical protein FOJ82_01115 [Tessaracoccus rhinocerotis]
MTTVLAYRSLMKQGKLIRILECVTVALVLAGCTGGAAVLAVPDGTNAVCAGVLPGKAEPYWFGIPVSNPGQSPITLKDVRLGEHDHIMMSDAFAVPAVQLDDGTMLGVGVMRAPAEESPELWSGRQSVAGYVIAPGADVHLALGLSRDGAETGRVHSQTITYRVDGELYDRNATSGLKMALTSDCQTLEEDK